MPNAQLAENKKRSVKNKNKSAGNVYINCEQQLAQIIKILDDNGRTGYEHVDIRLEETIDIIVTAKNRIQSIIQYTNKNNLVVGDID